MATLNILASYKDDKIVIPFQNSKDIIDVIKKRFSLPVNCCVKLQVWDDEWKEWINKHPHEVMNKDKVNVIAESKPGDFKFSIVTPSSALDTSWSEDEISSASSFASGSTIPVSEYQRSLMVSDINNDITEMLLEPEPQQDSELTDITVFSCDDDPTQPIALPSLPSPSHIGQLPKIAPQRLDKVVLKPWPTKFEIPVDSFPVDLRNSLARGKFPDERQRRKLIQVLFDKTAEYVRYPTKAQYDEVASALTEMYPCLTFNDIPSVKPHEFWKTKLSDKFRNERKHLVHSDEKIKSPPRKRVKSDIPLETEDEASIKMHQSWMKEELKKKSKNTQKLQNLMRLTYPHRRNLIVKDKLLVKGVREMYPALFETTELHHEFQRITGKQLMPALRESLSEIASKVLTLAEKKEQHKQFVKAFEEQLAIDQGQKAELQNACAVLVLAKMLSSADIISKESGKGLKNKITTPTLFWSGESPLNAVKYTVFAENESFGSATNAVTAIGNLIATYWIFDMAYPSGAKDFFSFSEVVLLKLSSSKATRSVNNLITKLKNFFQGGHWISQRM